MRLPDVCRVVGLGRSMVYHLESEGTFPQRVHIGLRAVGWVESEVRTWVARRVAARANPRYVGLSRLPVPLGERPYGVPSGAQGSLAVAEPADLAAGEDKPVCRPGHRNV